MECNVSRVIVKQARMCSKDIFLGVSTTNDSILDRKNNSAFG
jgi:hypothetical protein